MKAKIINSVDIQAAKIPFISDFHSYIVTNLVEGIVLFDHHLNKLKVIKCKQEVHLPLFKCFSQDLILLDSINGFMLVDIDTGVYKEVPIPEWVKDDGFSPLYWWKDPSRIIFCTYKGHLIDCKLPKGESKKLEPSELNDLYPKFFSLWSQIENFRYLVEAKPQEHEIVIKDLPHTRMIVKNILEKTEYYCSFPSRIFNFSYYKSIFAFTQQECMYLIDVKNKRRTTIIPPDKSRFSNKCTFINEHTFVVPIHNDSLYSYVYKLNLYNLNNY